MVNFVEREKICFRVILHRRRPPASISSANNRDANDEETGGFRNPIIGNGMRKGGEGLKTTRQSRRHHCHHAERASHTAAGGDDGCSPRRPRAAVVVISWWYVNISSVVSSVCSLMVRGRGKGGVEDNDRSTYRSILVGFGTPGMGGSPIFSCAANEIGSNRPMPFNAYFSGFSRRVGRRLIKLSD